jgi:hypothetical protein
MPKCQTAEALLQVQQIEQHSVQALEILRVIPRSWECFYKVKQASIQLQKYTIEANRTPDIAIIRELHATSLVTLKSVHELRRQFCLK